MKAIHEPRVLIGLCTSLLYLSHTVPAVDLLNAPSAEFEGNYTVRTLYDQPVIDLNSVEGVASSFSTITANGLTSIVVQVSVQPDSTDPFPFITFNDLTFGIGRISTEATLFFLQGSETGDEEFWEPLTSIPQFLMEKHFSLGMQLSDGGGWQLRLEGEPVAEFQPFSLPGGSSIAVFSPPAGNSTIYQVNWVEENVEPAGAQSTDISTNAGTEIEYKVIESSARYGLPPKSPPTIGFIELPIDTKGLRVSSPFKMSHKAQNCPVIHFKLTERGNWMFKPDSREIEKE